MIDYAAKERSQRKVTIILTFGMFVLFVVLASNGLAVIKQNAPQMLEGCVWRIATEPVFTSDIMISNADDADIVLETFLDTRASYTGLVMEGCGVSYKFAANGGQYVVCEGGEIYPYVKLCKGFAERTAAVMGLGKVYDDGSS